MVEGNSKESWKAEVKLNEHAVKFKVDTGADVTVIPPNIYHSLVPKPSLSKCDKTLMGPCKHKLCCLGSFTAKLCVDDKVVSSSCGCVFLRTRRSSTSAPTRQVLETGILSVESVDTRRIKICTDRKRSPGADLGLREIMGIRHWKVNLCGNGSQAFGPTVEHALTGPTPAKNPEIRDEADEIPLQRDQSRPWEEDVHR